MIYVLDLSEIADRQTLHTRLSSLPFFPENYGNNLDALFDVLSVAGKNNTLLFLNKESFSENLGDCASRFFRVVNDASLLPCGIRIIEK